MTLIGKQAVVCMATRGQDGPGEVVIDQIGGSESFIAYSDDPLPKGTEVVVYQTRGAGVVVVTPLTGSFD